MKSLIWFKTVDGVRYVHDEIGYCWGLAPYWVKDTSMEEYQKIMEWAKENPPMPKQYDSMDTTTNKEVNMPKVL